MLFSSFKYTIDTCSFTELRRAYPRDMFSAVWDKIDDMAINRIICSSEEVYYEIIKQDDELSVWIKDKRNIFIPHFFEIQSNVSHILTKHQSLLDLKKRKSGADPFLIAVAMYCDCSVVTEEKPSGGPDRVKIPDVCNDYGIECIRVLDLLRREGFHL